MNNKQLPLFEDKLILPTKKYHVSYSEISDWMDCSYRHKLKYVDKIILEDGSIHTAFGGAIHDAIEEFLINKKELNHLEVEADFRKRIKELSKPIEQKDITEFSSQIQDMLSQIPEFLNTTFPNYKVFAAELPLFESVEKQPGIYVKGYLDAIIKVDKKRGKGSEYYILDWKTTSWGWKQEQKQSFQKQLQLMLYKHFFCQLMNVSLTDVKCGFVLVKRVAPKKRKPFDRLEFVPVSVGPKSIEKSQEVLNDMINKVRKGFTMKNRMSCEPFCPYLNSPHCR